MKKYWFIPIILGVIYLYFGYTRFYSLIGEKSLPDPSNNQAYFFSNGQLTSQPDSNQQYYKYAALGDSLTAGVGTYSYEQTFPFMYAQRLAKTHTQLEFTNFGQPGARTIEVINYQLNPAIKQQPNLVTLLVGVNDIHDLQKQSSFEQHFDQIVNTLLQQTSAQIIILNIPYLGSNMILWPPYNYLFDMRTQQFNRTIEKSCNLERVICIDLYHQTHHAFQTNPDLYAADQFHPSEHGYLYFVNSLNAN
ncbi:SGNH/GDSL hydrolase family protein [Patescibacteria group bacterium]|nr:SGNH/GDSL hydrolase family protein [Patescibacteria group bacterium]